MVKLHFSFLDTLTYHLQVGNVLISFDLYSV